MKEEAIIRDAKIKFRGVIDIEVLYKQLREWYINAFYPEPTETKYAEKVKPEGKQIEIVWETKRDEEAGYFKIIQEVRFYVTKLTEVEVDK